MRIFIYVFILVTIVGCNDLEDNNVPVNVGDENNSGPLKEYYFDTTTVTVELPERLIDTSGSFTMEITREVYFRQDKRLTEKAESFFPPESLVNQEGHIDTSIVNNQSLWWYKQSGKIRIPYAITGSAVEYFINNIRWYQQNISSMISVRLWYNSKIDYYYNCILGNKRYERVFIVEQDLHYGETCGSLCGMGFEIKRKVIFDKDENVIGILGDGDTLVWIS